MPDVLINISRARIMLTANDVNAIPEPLLSRMFVFEIEATSANDIDVVAREVLRETVERLGIAFSLDLPTEVAGDA